MPVEDVLVADRACGRPRRRPPRPRACRPPFDRTDTTSPPGSDAAREPVEGEDAEDLVAIDDATRRVDGDEPVGVAVEGEPDVGAARHDRLGQRGRVRGPAADVDVDAIRLDVDGLDLGAGRGQDAPAPTPPPDPLAPSSTMRRPVGLDAGRQAAPMRRRRPRPGRAASIRRPSRALPTPPSSPSRQMSCSSSSSMASSSLSPSASRTLSPLSSAGLCEAETMIPAANGAGPGEVGEGRRRDDADDVDVDAEAGRAGRDGGHEHVARAARVLADDDGAAGAAQAVRRRPAEGVGEGRLEVDVGDAADAVGAEES